MYSVRPNRLMRKVYSSALWRVRTKEKKIFLTFDDGPVPEITPWVLSVLKEHKAKATFFCIGDNIEKNTDIFRQVIAEGHTIGNHTYNHLNGWKTNSKVYLENVEKCQTIIQKNSDSQSKISTVFRPPYGRMKRSQFSSLKYNYSVVMWDVLSGDFDETISEEKCLKNVLSKTREGSIVVFHDSIKSKKNLFFALPKFLEYFSQRGYTFSALSV